MFSHSRKRIASLLGTIHYKEMDRIFTQADSAGSFWGTSMLPIVLIHSRFLGLFSEDHKLAEYIINLNLLTNGLGSDSRKNLSVFLASIYTAQPRPCPSPTLLYLDLALPQQFLTSALL